MTTSSVAAGREVARELTIDVPIEAVWKALTDATELMRWFPLEARVTPGPGGVIWMKWDGDVYQAESPIEIWEAPHHLRTVFPLHDPVRLATDYHLQSEKGQTVLRVVTSGFGQGTDWDEWFAAVGTGWDFELRGLKHYLERHRGQNRVALSVRARHNTSDEKAWDLLTGTRGWLGFAREPIEGAPYSARTPTGERLTGVVQQWFPGRQVVLTVDQYNDAILRLELERGHAMVLWMSTWGIPEPELRALERGWQRSIEKALL